jgi:hypothetical protein
VTVPAEQSDAARADVRIVRAGFRRDRTAVRLAVLAWLVTVAVTLVSVWPAWRWWSAVLEYAPRGDTMAQRFDFVVFKEIVQFDRGSASGMTAAALAAGTVLALLLNPFLSGGVLGVLASPNEGIAPRFFASGAQLYGRFVRALVYVGIPAAIAIGLVAAAGQASVDLAADRGLERAAIVLAVVWIVAAIAVAGFFTAVLDLARLSVLLRDSREVLAAVLSALGFAVRQLGALLRLGVVFAIWWLALFAGVIGLRAVLPSDGWVWLLIAILLQQGASYARMRLRVAVMASELALARGRSVAAAAASE